MPLKPKASLFSAAVVVAVVSEELAAAAVANSSALSTHRGLLMQLLDVFVPFFHEFRIPR
jgi:hypothetical protein